MKTTNILIPTDFSLATLSTVNTLIAKHPDQKFNFYLVHFLQLSDSITELLMLQRRSREYLHIGSEFEDQLTFLRQQHPQQIGTLHAEFFYGSTVAVFKNFLEAKDIDMIAMLNGHTYQKLTANSIAPELLVQRSGYPVLSLSAITEVQPAERAVRIQKLELELEQA
jgi:hypothetical protein